MTRSSSSGAWRFIAAMVGRTRARTVALVGLLALSGVAETIGTALLLPLLGIVAGQRAAAPSPLIALLEGAAARVGVVFDLPRTLLLIVGAVCLKSGMRLLAMRRVSAVVARFAADLRTAYLDGLLAARWHAVAGTHVGLVGTVMGAEVLRASSAYQQLCALLANVVQVSLYLLCAFALAWDVALLMLVAGGVIVAVHLPLTRRAHEASREQTALQRSLNVRLTDVVAGLKAVKAMGREAYVLPQVAADVEALRAAQERQVGAVELSSAMREPLAVVLLAVTLLVALEARGTAFGTVLVVGLLFMRLAGRVAQAQAQFQEIAIGAPAFEALTRSIREVSAAREPTGGTRVVPRLRDRIVLEHVCFAFENRTVLRDVSADLPAGSIITLIGPSGAGKTTLGELLAGLRRPTSGRILIDGTDLASLELSRWRGAIGYVPQEPLLFRDTVLQNVTLGDPAIGRAEALAALRAAGADAFVEQLPEGMDTFLPGRDCNLSGGQRQRIAVARALARHPRLLILDEITASLDAEHERGICDALADLRARLTVVAISHRPAMVAIADVVLRLESGRLVPADLMVGA
jgi:ATP-binding cassette, subfamily C, bacterial